MTRNSQLFALFALVLGLVAFRFEDNFLTKIVSKLDTYQQLFPQEKVYLHLDRPYYTAGERVWFKAYATLAADNTADTLSHVLYVDLVDKQKGKVLLQKKIKLENGVGQGELRLSDSLQMGDYQIRAYTQWMRNFSDELFFCRDLRILRTDLAINAPILPPNTDDIDIQILPEGGFLVKDVESRVAFKAVNVMGKGAKVMGFVLNQANDTIVGFESEHLGMGSFNFKPEQGQQYRMQIRKPNGDFKTVQMPEIKAEGFVMTVDNLSNKDNVRVYIRNSKPADATGEIALIAHNQGVVSYAAKAALGKKSMLFNIPKAKLGDGITHLTLFDDQSRPICERLIFLNNSKPLQVQLTPAKSTYQPRQKVEVEIAVKDAEGKPVEGSFSLAATDAKQVVVEETTAPQNIASYLRLEADLHGNIEQPATYFDSQNPNAVRQLDLLLMTQGWRRFMWDDILKEKYPDNKYFLERGVSFTGQVLRLNNKAPGKINLTFMLRQLDSTQLLLMGQTIETGEFAAYNLDIIDTTQVLIQASSEKGNRNFNIKLTPFALAPVTITKIPYNPIAFDPKVLAEYLSRAKEYLDIERRIRESREKMLQEVVIKGKKEDPMKKDSRRMMYGGDPDNTVKFDNMNTAGAMTIFDVIQSRVPGVQVSGSGMNRTIQIRGAANFSGAIEPLFLLDGTQVSKDAIMSIPPNDVEAVDILKGASASMYGSQGAGGVVAILTKRGNTNYDWGTDEAPGTLVTKILGYSPNMQFYMPNYDKPIADHVRPDYRATVFWEPAIKTDKDGKAKVSFFATDAQTTLNLQIEGMTPTGMMGVGKGNVTIQ